MKKYADVIVPLPVAGEFTYSLPDGMAAEAGCRVVVPFGAKKFYTGIVTQVHDTPPEGHAVKEVSELLDAAPVVLPGQLAFWRWMADYYLCAPGDVYKSALPTGMKLESETWVECSPDFEAEEPLAEREQRLLDLLSRSREQTITRLAKESGLRNILPLVRSLLDKGAIKIKEELKHSYRPRMEMRVRTAVAEMDEAGWQAAFRQLKGAPKQAAVLMKYVELSGWSAEGGRTKDVSRKELLEQSGASPAALGGLVEKGILGVYRQRVERQDEECPATEKSHPLSDSQRQAYDSILQSFREKNVCLLHGVTSSGKTEIYIHLIEETLAQGRQVLYLLPEIALTTQVTGRLRRVFGRRMGVWHSKFPDAERVEIWQKQLRTDCHDIILGARSAIFLPFRRLGLVIVDEEHESSYKQQDPAPRYQARDAAVMLASMSGAKVLLGTATPSMESYSNAIAGKYGLVELKERYKNIRLPRIEPVDIRLLAHRKQMQGPFSPQLTGRIREALERKEQVILFQNRRGFAPQLECPVCGWVPKCTHCDVSLTYHKETDCLTCHYCGYTCPVPRSCPACEETNLRRRGFGTERIEDDIRNLFPEARVARMDLDTARTRAAYERIIADFEQGRTDILIGTQMVSKGLDFDHVSVVGILHADGMLNYPDFRSHERAFQLMAQVAGRAGRKDKQGLVILQTKSMDLPIIRQVTENDYGQLYRDQLAERRLFRYPPCCRLVYVYLKHRREDVLGAAAGTLAARLRTGLGGRVLGPDRPPVARIQSLFIRKIMIKVEQEDSLSKVRAYLRAVQRSVLEDERFRSLLVYYDVDPA